MWREYNFTANFNAMPVNIKIFKVPLFLIVLLAGFAAGAQENTPMYEDRTFYGGLILGGNFTQIDGDNFAGYTRKGLNAGGVVFFKMDEHIAASVEVLFSQKGSVSKDPQVLAPGVYINKYGADLNYGEVPVMINYYDDRKNHFGGGLSYSRLATSNEYITMTPSPTTPFKQEDYPFKKSDFNLLLGGNLHLYKGFFLNLRFQYSLISIRNTVPNITRGAQFNNMWTIRLMYLFL